MPASLMYYLDLTPESETAKNKKLKLRLIKGEAGGTSGQLVTQGLGMPYLDVPENFRSTSFSQAIMEYGVPIVEHAGGCSTLRS